MNLNRLIRGGIQPLLRNPVSLDPELNTHLIIGALFKFITETVGEEFEVGTIDLEWGNVSIASPVIRMPAG